MKFEGKISIHFLPGVALGVAVVIAWALYRNSSIKELGKNVGWVGQIHPSFSVQTVTIILFIPQVTKELKNLNKKVVECTWDAENNQWKFLRVREDKSFPNGYNTALSEFAF